MNSPQAESPVWQVRVRHLGHTLNAGRFEAESPQDAIECARDCAPLDIADELVGWVAKQVA
jgi:hypothetical protein